MVGAGALSFLVLLGWSDLWGINEPGARHLLSAAAIVCVLAVWDYAAVRGRMMLLTGVWALVFGVGAATGYDRCLRFMDSYWRWMGNRPVWEPAWMTGYEMAQSMLLVIVCYLVQLVLEKDFRLKAIGTAAILAALLQALFTGRTLPTICVALTICYIVLTYAEWTQIHWQKEKGKSRQAYMLWLLPFMAVYFILMAAPQFPEEPYDWGIARNIYMQVRESLTRVSQNLSRIGNEDYDLSLRGFTDRGNLGGDNMSSDHEVMKLYDINGLATDLYLSGKVYDTFDGKQWQQLNMDSEKERYLDTLETVYALRRFDDAYFADYMKYGEFKVDYRYFHSEYLFAPLKLMKLTKKGERLAFREEGGSLYFDKPKGYGTKYEAAFYQMNAGQHVFQEFLESAGTLEPDRELLDKLCRETEQRTGEKIAAGELETHRQSVYEYYAQEITVSEETEQYLENRIAWAQTDLERLQAIEEMLNDYEYTLTPEELPDSVTDSGKFLDYFLLESQSGYCTHFATAFTLLARKEGFPARYVQGFCVPVTGAEEIKVYSDMAHAWPEVYLDGIGWIPFEPTPGYADIRYGSWVVQRQNNGHPSCETDEEKIKNGDADTFVQLQPDEVELRQQTGYKAGRTILWIFRLFVVALLCALGAGMAVAALYKAIGTWRYERMDVQEQFRTIVYRNLQILSLMGLKRREETLEEFGIRTSKALQDGKLMLFLKAYEDMIYGGHEMDQRRLEEARMQQRELERLLWEKRKWAYLYYQLTTSSWPEFLTRSK